MANIPEGLDSSKSADQKLFDSLSAEQKEEIVGRAQEEAEHLRSLIEQGVAANYDEALEKSKELKDELLPGGLIIDQE